jgi:hypothetical protein
MAGFGGAPEVSLASDGDDVAQFVESHENTAPVE